MLTRKIYEGSEPYIFISYAHRDEELVIPIIERLIDDGYRVWCDEGIVPGSEWDEYIAEHIVKCSCMISMISKEYMASKNCRDELKFARNENKEQLLIYLHSTNLTKGMRMRLDTIQAVFKYAYKDEEKFYKKLYEAHILAPCQAKKEAPRQDQTPEEVYTADKKQEMPAPKTEDQKKKSKGRVLKIALAAVASVLIVTAAVFTFLLHPRIKYVDSGYATCYVDKLSGIFYDEHLIIPGSSPTGNRVTKIGDGAFAACDKLKSVVIPSSVTEIGKRAFIFCYGLEEITIPDGVTAFGERAFSSCESLKSIVIPRKMTDIEESSFLGCRALKEVTIHVGITQIGQLAFYDCNLLSIYYEGTMEQWHAIEKGENWDGNNPSYTVHCADGNISQSDTPRGATP